MKTGCWFGEAFLFTNSANRLQYYVGGELVSVAHLDQPMYLLGYLASESRVFLINRDLKVRNSALYLLKSTLSRITSYFYSFFILGGQLHVIPLCFGV